MFKSAANLLALSVAGLALAPFFAVAGEAHHPNKPLHARRAVAHNPERNNTARAVGPLNKRAQHTNARATWYDVEVGLGACGQQSYANQLTIALNHEEWGQGFPGPRCFTQVQIFYKGKSVVATVMDQCPSPFCSYGMIDLSKATFESLASLDDGQIFVEWDFLDGSAPAQPDAKPPPPKQDETTTSTTSTQETTTTTSSERPTTTSSSSSTTSTTSSTSASSSASIASGTSSSISSSLTEPASSGAITEAPKATKAVSTPQGGIRGENISNIFELAVQLGNVVGNAAQVKPGPVRRDL